MERRKTDEKSLVERRSIFALPQRSYNFIWKQRNQTRFLHEVVTLFISGNGYSRIYFSKAFLSSSMLTYPFMSGVRDMRLASSIAASVRWL